MMLKYYIFIYFLYTVCIYIIYIYIYMFYIYNIYIYVFKLLTRIFILSGCEEGRLLGGGQGAPGGASEVPR